MCKGVVPVNGVMGERKMVQLWDNKAQMEGITVQKVKEKVQAEFPNIPGHGKLQLCVDGKTLDDSTLKSKCLPSLVLQMFVIQLVVKVHGG